MGGAPRIEHAVRAFILNDILEGQDPGELTDTTPLLSTAILDSMATLKLVLFLEKEFSISIDAAEVDAAHLDTIELIAQLVRAKTAGTGPDGSA